MRHNVSIAAAGIAAGFSALVLFTGVAHAQTPAAGACLTAEQKATNAGYYALNRPTSRDDQMPFFDPEYFAGTWNFESRFVDSPLGAGGESFGTVTIKSSGGCGYVGDVKGEDPDGKPFTRKITLNYDGAKKMLSWTEVDSRGYTLNQSGVVGGELGGLFHHHFEDAPAITVRGRKLRIGGVSEMSSPAYFKTDYKVSIDGGPLMTFGRTTFEKQMAGTK